MFKAYRTLSRNTLVLSLTVGVVLSAYFMWSPLIALHLRDLGANEFQIGVAFSAFTLAHALPAMFGGILADRVGRKWVITAPGFLLIPLYILAGLTRDWVVLTALLVGTNFVGALQWPAMQALISESDEKQRARAFSFLEIFVLGAAIAGPLVGSFLLSYFGIGGLIVLHGVALIPATLARILKLRETHHAAHRAAWNFHAWRASIPRAAMWIIAANALFALALGLSFQGPFSALLMNDVWLLNEQQIQWVNAAGAAFALLGVWLGGKADRWGGRRIWIGSAIGFALTLVGWGFSPRWEIGVIFFLGAHVCYETIFIVAETMLAQHSARANRSSVFGLMATVSGFTTAAGPTLGAWAAALTSLAAPFVLAAVAMLASLVPLARVPDEKTAASEEGLTEEIVVAQLAE